MILLIDNYDSFVYNLGRYFQLLGCPVEVVRNDKITVAQVQQQIRDGSVRAVVLSPGPCSPREAGICLSLVSRIYQQVPLLGVCLGHQAIAQALGGDVDQWDSPIHGQADWIQHDQQHDFAQVPNPFSAARYHSLVVRESTLPSFFDISARLADGTIMGIRHKRLPVVGYQFHPESVLTPAGMNLLAGFLHWVKLPFRADYLSEKDAIARPRELDDQYPPGCQPISSSHWSTGSSTGGTP